MAPSIGTGSDLRSDADLIVAARSGDAGAFGVLYERHAGAALIVARQYTSGTAEAEDVVADAFAAVWSALRGGSGPTDAFRAYLFTVVRRAAAVQRDRGRRAEPTDDVAVLEAGSMAEPAAEEPALAEFERSLVARAYGSLPERWQAVLWHSEVEGRTPAEIAPLLGLTANSTAALAYRAREGLRQAYLQQHLSDDLPETCRAVAGKLGSYVRGGLGARDTAQVESHLETCGDCRALVLELRDVNHGLRSVIAPLVLGIAGLGALRFVLPMSGGLAAGTASLASGGAAAGGGGAAGAGAEAGGGAASGGGVVGAAAAGVGAVGAIGVGVAAGAAGASAAGAAGTSAAGAAAASAVGAAGASGGAAAGGLFGAIGGFLASVPTVLVAGIAGVIVIAGATVGAIALNGGHDEPAVANPGNGSTSSTAPSTPGGSGSPTGPSGVLADTGGEPTSAPASSEASAGGSSSGGSAGGTSQTSGAAGAGSSGSGTGGTNGSGGGSSSGGGAGSGSSDGGSTPTTPPVEPTAPPVEPTVPPVEPTAPAVEPTEPATTGAPNLVVDTTSAELVAGESGQELGVDLTNTGTGPATHLQAQVDLPVGVDPETVTQQIAGRFAVHLAASPWNCAVTGSGVSCALPELAAGDTTHLSFLVSVDEAFDTPNGAVTWHVTADQLPDMAPYASSIPVTPAPARLAFVDADQPSLALLRGRDAILALGVRNAGGLAVSASVPATVDLAVPTGLTVTAAPDGDWTCGSLPGGDVRCTDPTLGARSTSTLTLNLAVGATFAGADPATGAIDLTLNPAGKGTAAVAAVDYTVRTPARLVTSSVPTQLAMTPGVVAHATVTVKNVGDVDAEGVVATLSPPAGAAWDSRVVPGWACFGTDGGDLVCSLDELAAGASAPLTVALKPVVPTLLEPGDLVVTAAAPDADPASVLKVPAVADVGLRYRGAGALDVTEVGAPLLGCSQDVKSHCWDQDKANDNDFDMEPVNLAPAPGEVSLVSSSTTLTLPEGVKASDVTFAGLYWSANKAPGDGWTTNLGTAQLQGPGGVYTPVKASSTPTVQDSSGRTYYQSFADVTEQVQQLGSGAWSLADAAAAKGRTDTDRTYYAGWSLVVVYRAATVAPTTTVSVYDGAAWVASNSSRGVGIATGKGATVKIGVVAWDGDRNTTGDCLSLDATALSPGCGDRPTSQANTFDSTATGWPYVNSLGVDAKSFDPVTAKGATSALTASTTGDQYLLGVLTTRVTP